MSGILAFLAGLFGVLKEFGVWLNAQTLRQAGRDEARADTAEKNNAALVDKAKVDADVGSLSDSDLDRELQGWTKPGTGN